MSAAPKDFAAQATQAAQLFASGQVAAAAEVYGRLVQAQPQAAELHFNLACTLRALNDSEGALAGFGRAAALRPRWVSPLVQQGILLFVLERWSEAQSVFERVLALEPSNLAGHFNLARTHIALMRWRLAIPHLQAARRLAPGNEEVWMTLRDTLRLTGQHGAALADFLEYEKVGQPSIWTMIANLSSCRSLGDPEREARAVAAALAWPYEPRDAAIVAEALMVLHYFDVSREALFGLYQTYNRLMRQSVPALAQATRRPGKRWRIGYVSADFRRHVMGPLMAQILLEHDAARFEIYCYSLAPAANEDDLSTIFRDLSARFLRLEDLSDEAAARAIADDDVDVLVDLMAHTTFARPGIYGHRPARLMVTHLGYHGALGLEEIDFKLSDRHVDLPENDRFLIEKLLPMDCCVLPFRHVAAAATPPISRVGLGLPDEAVLFGTFVSNFKMSPRCLEVWRQVLEDLPQAYLAFSPYVATERENLLRQLHGFGIKAERVVWIPPGADQSEGRARYLLLDAVLDTFPYSGGDTTMAALDMAVPVVTLTGLRQGERMSLSILTHLGVTETIAMNEAEYRAIAVRLACEPAWRQEISRKIAQQLSASGLADTKRYTRALEEAYLEALRRKGLRRDEQILPD
ncbi:MAG: hypothetical protein HYZ17_18110 [Betaproteobacteria bacterium]|nr:hypothetical protein [Betaproteobacteria bacterium]